MFCAEKIKNLIFLRSESAEVFLLLLEVTILPDTPALEHNKTLNAVFELSMRRNKSGKDHFSQQTGKKLYIKVERAGVVKPGKQRAPGRPYCDLSVYKRDL